MESLLQVKDLTVHYRSANSTPFQAVEGVSFDIAPGEVLGVMGESGCGKTSIALALLGLLPKDQAEVSGSVLFRGDNLLLMDERSLQRVRGAEISMVYQEPGIALSPVMRVGMQIAEVVRAHGGWNWKRCRDEARSTLTRVGLDSTDRIFSAYPHQLSGGQLQRVVLAQALACGPILVIADEPTASLDAQSQSDFIALLRDMKRDMHLSLLLISHTPEIQASLSDHLLVMKDGLIVEEGSFDRLYSSPSHPYTRALLRRNSPAVVRENSESEYFDRALLVR
jgi:peptide/nickel transport system ATP-binding protein